MKGTLDTRLADLASGTRPLEWLVVGAGNGGLTFAGLLGMRGERVRLYNRSKEHLEGVLWQGGIRMEGEVDGFGPVQSCTTSMKTALKGADIVMVATPATAHRDLARLMAPHLVDGMVIVLNPGRTGGTLEFIRELKQNGSSAEVLVGEAQTLLFATRAKNYQVVQLNRTKQSVPLACVPSWRIPALLKILKPHFPGFVAGSNVLATSLENIGAVFHPVLTILNAGWIESTEGNFQYYLDGISPSTARILEAVDNERVSIAEALGIRTVSAREWLYLSYQSSGASLLDAIKTTDAYRGIMAPSSTDVRYITEDVPMSLVPLSSLGTLLRVPTPAIDMMIDLACIMHNRDYGALGRTVETLGLSGMGVQQIRSLVTGD